jgi:hypothetical protein
VIWKPSCVVKLNANARNGNASKLPQTETCKNAYADLTAKNREIDRLKALLEKQWDTADQDSDAGPVKDLLLFFKMELNKSSSFDIKPSNKKVGGKRWEIADAAIKRWGVDRCKLAIIGLKLRPYSGPRGRQAEQYPGIGTSGRRGACPWRRS